MKPETPFNEEIEQIIGSLWEWATKYSVLMGTFIMHKEFTDILDRIDKLKEPE